MLCITDVDDNLSQKEKKKTLTYSIKKTTLTLSNIVYSTVARDWIHANTRCMMSKYYVMQKFESFSGLPVGKKKHKKTASKRG